MGQQTAVHELFLKWLHRDLTTEDFEQAEETQKMNMELTWIEACKYALDFIKDNTSLESKEAFQQYYKKTYK
jgi:hypothetical protein